MDIKNASNEGSRAAAAHELRYGNERRFSWLLPLFNALYGQPNQLFVSMKPGTEPAKIRSSKGNDTGLPSGV